MSDAHADHDLPHEGPIKTPKQLVWAIVAAFVVPIVIIILMVNYVVADKMPAAGSSAMTPEAVAQRIQPVGKVEIKDVRAAARAEAVPALYTQACAVCHVAGVANAPKLGDKAAWAPRLAAGVDGLTASVIKGKGAMPPKGGTSASDAEIKAVVTYMVASVK